MNTFIAIPLLAVLLMLCSAAVKAETVQVLDSKGVRVGTFYPPNQVLRKIQGQWVFLLVDTNGFVGDDLEPFFTTVDCSGTAYLIVLSSSDLVQVPSIAKQHVIAQPNLSSLQVRALLSLLTIDGQCLPSSGGSFPSVTFTTFDLSTLGLKPPFSVHRSIP